MRIAKKNWGRFYEAELCRRALWRGESKGNEWKWKCRWEECLPANTGLSLSRLDGHERLLLFKPVGYYYSLGLAWGPRRPRATLALHIYTSFPCWHLSNSELETKGQLFDWLVYYTTSCSHALSSAATAEMIDKPCNSSPLRTSQSWMSHKQWKWK